MHRLLFTILFLLLGSHAWAATSKLDQAGFADDYQREDLQLQRKSQTVLVYLWVDVYAAALYAPANLGAGESVEQMADQRLELYYFREISRQDVIKAAWVALERQHKTTQLDALRTEIDALHQTFRDIKAGDRYALTYAQGELSLEVNGQTLYRNDNPELARAYLGIWLAPDGLSDKLRNDLLQKP